MIRDAVSAYLRDEQETEITWRIVEGYQRRPQESDADSDEWGDLGALADFAARETLTMLTTACPHPAPSALTSC